MEKDIVKIVVTIDEINKIGELLADCPLKFSMPVVDYLRALINEKTNAQGDLSKN